MRIITHSGSFHADDVFAVAALMLRFGKCEVIRTRDAAIIESGDVVVDVGRVYDPARKRFDHHQGGVGERANGIPYAAFGLVWKEWGRELAGSAEAMARVDARLVQAVDAIDVGVSISAPRIEGVRPYEISAAVGAWTPAWSEDAARIDSIFMQAVEWAGVLLRREIVHAIALTEAGAQLARCYATASDPRVLVLDAPYPFHEFTDAHPDILYIVVPASSGEGWKAEAARIHSGAFDLRRPFPEAWRGKEGAELQAGTGVADAVFCHAAGFAAYARSQEGALALVGLALSAG